MGPWPSSKKLLCWPAFSRAAQKPRARSTLVMSCSNLHDYADVMYLTLPHLPRHGSLQSSSFYTDDCTQRWASSIPMWENPTHSADCIISEKDGH